MLFQDGDSTAHTASSGKNSRAGNKPTGKKCEIKCIATALTTEHVGRRVHIIFQQTGTSECAVLKEVSTASSSKWNVEFDDGRMEWVDLGQGDDQNPWRFEEESGSNKSDSSPECSSKDHDTEAKSKDLSSNEVAPQESSAPLDDEVACLDSDDDAAPTRKNPAKAIVVSGTSASSQPEMSAVNSRTVNSGISIPPSGCESVPQVSGPREVPKAQEGVAPKPPSSTQFNHTQESPAPSSSPETKNPFAGVSEVIQSGTTPAKPIQHETKSDFVSVRGEVYEVHDVPGDGSCLYHALLKGSFPPDISRALPEDGFALRQVISDFAFRGKFQGRELDQNTQELLRSKVMVAHGGREVLEALAKEENTTVDTRLMDRLISNKTKENKKEYYGSTYEALMFALMFNVNVITVSNTSGGFEITESDGQVEVYKLQEIATQLHPDKGENEKHRIVLYHFLLGSVREPRELPILNHVAFLEPVDPSRKIELLSKKGLVYSNDKVHRHSANPDNPIDVDKDDSVDLTPSIASLSQQLVSQPVPDKGMPSQQGGKDQSLDGQPPLDFQGTSTDQRTESEQPSDSAASSASAQLLGGITTTEPSNIGVIGSPQKQSSVSGPLPQEQVTKEGNLSEQELKKIMSEVSVLNVGDLIRFKSKSSGKVREGVVEKLPDDGDPEKRWHIRKIGDSKFGSYNLENYYCEIRKPEKSRPGIADTGIKKKEAAKKTDSVNSASAPAAMSTEPSDSVKGEEVASTEPPRTEGDPLVMKADPPQDEITESNNTVAAVTPESSPNSQLPQLSLPAKRSEPIPPKESTQPSTSNLHPSSTMESSSTSCVEDSTTKIGTVKAMSSVASAPGNGSRAEQNRPEKSGEASPGSGDGGSSPSLPPDQSQQSIWVQAKEVLVQRKLPKIVELFLGLVNGGGKKFYLTKEQVGVIDLVHFLEDSRKNCEHLGNFQYDFSASLQEMFSMCYFLSGEGCLLEMYRELLIDEKTVEDGFFKDQDNEKFKEYRDKMKNTIMSLSIMLCPGICRKMTKNQILYTSNLDRKKENFGKKLSEAFGSGKLALHRSEESDSKEGANGYKEFDPNNAGEDFLLGVEHKSSYLVDFLLMPRAMCSSLADNVCVTEAVGCVDTNHRKVNTAAMKEKESGQSLRETWDCTEKCERLLKGVGSTTRTSALFERKCNEVFDPSQLEKVNDCGGDLSVRKGKAHLEGCMHFQKRKCQEVVGPSLLEAATLLLVTLVSHYLFFVWFKMCLTNLLILPHVCVLFLKGIQCGRF